MGGPPSRRRGKARDGKGKGLERKEEQKRVINEKRHQKKRFTPTVAFNLLMGTLKPQFNGPLYSNVMIGTLAADG